MNLSYENLEKVIKSKGYKFFTGEYNLNIVGIRSKNRMVDNWDDFLCILYEENKIRKCIVFDRFTTDPGIYYMQKKLLNPKGCGILAPGQYSGIWTLGLHRNKYKAFIQTGNEVTAYRDRNLNNYMDFDPNTLESGYFGCNLHHGYDSTFVGNNSAMCQVLKYVKDLRVVLALADKQISAGYGSTFTYTLLREEDL